VQSQVIHCWEGAVAFAEIFSPNHGEGFLAEVETNINSQFWAVKHPGNRY
jgi:hypothetical protein